MFFCAGCTCSHALLIFVCCCIFHRPKFCHRSKPKKNPLPPANERKQGNVHETNAPAKVEKEKPAPPIEQTTVIVEQLPTDAPTPAPTPIPSTPDANKAIDFAIKHPLNSKWTLWYYLPEKSADWEKCQHRIHKVDTVEDFWSLADHIQLPSELHSGVDYSFFKNDIRPMWEDPQNVKGGRLTVISASKVKSAQIDEVWLDVLLFLIGENHPNADSVCGVVLNTRNYGMKIAVWTSTQDGLKIAEIAKSIKASLSSSMVQSIPFEVHTDTQKKAHVYNKSSSRGPMNWTSRIEMMLNALLNIEDERNEKN